MITLFFNFYIDEVDLDFKSTSPEDEDKGSEGKHHVAMETMLDWNLCQLFNFSYCETSSMYCVYCTCNACMF